MPTEGPAWGDCIAAILKIPWVKKVRAIEEWLLLVAVNNLEKRVISSNP